MDRACSTNGEEKGIDIGFGRKAKGKRPLRRFRCRWVDNITMDLTVLG
jgi:hypothetical protein